MIRIRDLYVGYGSEPVLKGVNLDIEPGGINVLLGPNGSGKTTLLKTVMGLLKPLKGHVSVMGLEPYGNPVEVRRSIGYLPEEDIVYHSLKVKEYLGFVARVYGVPRDRFEESIGRVMDAFMIRDYSGQAIGELSHGLKRRVMLAAAFVHDPPILLLDEPFIGIDPRIAKALKIALKEKAKEGKTILVTTHVLELAEALADHVILIYKGEVRARGSVKEVVHQAGASGLEEAFLNLTMSSELVKELVQALIGS